MHATSVGIFSALGRGPGKRSPLRVGARALVAVASMAAAVFLVVFGLSILQALDGEPTRFFVHQLVAGVNLAGVGAFLLLGSAAVLRARRAAPWLMAAAAVPIANLWLLVMVLPLYCFCSRIN